MTITLRRYALTAALLVCAAGACRTVPTLSKLRGDYDALARERQQLIAANQSPSEVDRNLAALAAEASDAAREESDPKAAVAFWRIAALAAWQGGAQGHEQVSGIVTAGAAACERLAPPDFAAPGDCLLIRMTPIRTGYEEARARVLALEAKSKPLPRADGDEIQALFNGLEGRFAEATSLGQRFAASDIDPGQLAAVDDDRARIFCLARIDLNLLTAVDGNQLDAITPFAPRRDAMRASLPPDRRAAPCP